LSEWKKVELSALVEISKGKQINRLNLDKQGDYYVLNGGVEPSGYLDKWNTETDTISISEGGNSCGYVKYNTSRFWSGGHCYTLEKLVPYIDCKYLYFYLKYNQKNIMKLRTGTGLPNIKRNTLMTFPIFYPTSLTEQQKIAEILTTADKAITASRALLEKYAAVKLGLLQDLLGNGEEVTLGEIGGDSFKYGLNAAAITYDGKNKYLRITDIDENTRTFSKENLTSPNGQLFDDYLLAENDIVFARTGASVGKTYIYDNADGKVYFAGYLIRCSVKKEFCAKYIFYQTLTDEYNSWVSINSQRSGQPGVNAEQYKKYTFKCPPLAEQQRIAEILTAADNRITAEQKHLAKLEKIKQGLMHDLLTNKISTI